jgi:hypothetical protein
MVTIKPLKLLVCLAVLLPITLAANSLVLAAPDMGGLGIQGDALSADPTKSTQVIRTTTKSSTRTYSSKPIPRYSPEYAVNAPPVVAPMSATAMGCPPQGCPPQGAGGFGLFSQPGMPFGPGGCGGPIYLPKPGCKQFTINAKLWYATLNSSKIIWGTDGLAQPGTTLSLTDELGLSKHQYIAEYEARCQIRQNWGLRFSFMPLAYRENFWPKNFFFFGNALYTPGISTLTKWNRNIYRWDIVYDWFNQCHAVSSVFAGYALYDDKLCVSNNLWRRSRSQGFGLAFAGLSIEKALQEIGPATLSMNCKWSTQFLEGYFGWDGYAAGRITVPFDYGRFGYVEAGWRWIVLNREYPTNTDNTNLEGLIGAVGLIF